MSIKNILLFFMIVLFIKGTMSENKRISVIFNNDNIQPTILGKYKSNNEILFSYENSLYLLNLLSLSYQKIYSFSKGNITGILYDDETENIYISLHSYDLNYNPDESNGVWLLSNNITKKVIKIDKNKIYFPTSIFKFSSNVFYFLDSSKGNIWWFDTEGSFGILIGKDKKSVPNYYTGGQDTSLVQNLSQYCQNGESPGIVSGFLYKNEENFFILNNFGGGFSIIVKLSSDGKSTIAIPHSFNVHPFTYAYSGCDSESNEMYIGVAEYITTSINYGSRILKCSIGDFQSKVFIEDKILEIVGSLIKIENSLYVTSFSSLNKSKILSIDLL